MKAGEGLTGRYCLLQGSYYGVNCAVIGYASVFLLERGMSPAGIGALIAAGNVLSAVLQPMAAGIADRSGRVTLKQMIRLAAAAGAILSLLVGVFGSLKLIAPLYMALAMIANLEMPLVNAVSVYFSNRGYRINFGLARGIGSLTYAAFSYGLGLLAGMFGAGLHGALRRRVRLLRAVLHETGNNEGGRAGRGRRECSRRSRWGRRINSRPP